MGHHREHLHVHVGVRDVCADVRAAEIGLLWQTQSWRAMKQLLIFREVSFGTVYEIQNSTVNCTCFPMLSSALQYELDLPHGAVVRILPLIARFRCAHHGVVQGSHLGLEIDDSTSRRIEGTERDMSTFQGVCMYC